MLMRTAGSDVDNHSIADHLPETPESDFELWLLIGVGVVVLYMFARGWVAVGAVASKVLRPLLGGVVICIIAVGLASDALSGVGASLLALGAAAIFMKGWAYGHGLEEDG